MKVSLDFQALIERDWSIFLIGWKF